MKLCVNCKHVSMFFRSTVDVEHGRPVLVCMRPGLLTTHFDVTNGGIRNWRAACSDQRSARRPSLCTPEGKFFEESLEPNTIQKEYWEAARLYNKSARSAK